MSSGFVSEPVLGMVSEVVSNADCKNLSVVSRAVSGVVSVFVFGDVSFSIFVSDSFGSVS
ncbi:hypothetical protein HK096_003198 [Nowakowskiella sp. JEL0078]|nr:hypothetical protein HK096_003198 [Nowakowskiella sp. JEL0078]